jgi:hypothetical protein
LYTARYAFGRPVLVHEARFYHCQKYPTARSWSQNLEGMRESSVEFGVIESQEIDYND